MSITRYGLKYRGGGESTWEGEMPDGQFCDYSEYEDERARKEKAKAHREKLLEMLNEILSENPSCSCFDWNKYRAAVDEISSDPIWES